MATSDPLIFTGVDIGGTVYEATDSDNIEIGNEAEKLTVDNAQEIISSLTSSITVPTFDLSVQNDANVIMDSVVDLATDKTTISLVGAAGSSTVTISDVIVTGVLKFDRPSPYVQLSANIKGASSQITIS